MPSGFLYSVKAVVDKGSFQDGINELKKLGDASKTLLAGITGLAAGAVSSATIAGEVAAQELKVAGAIGVSSEALSSWKIAANIAGASASGLIGQLVSLESKMQHLKTGTVDMNLAKSLGMMGIGYGDFADMNSEQRMRAVFNQAGGMEDQELAATLVGDILGQAGQDYYNSLKMSGKSIEQQLAEAKKLNFVSNQNRKEAALFASEVKSIKEAGKSITMLFGSEMARALHPTVRQVKSYLINNREQIRKGIAGFAQNIGAVFNAIAGVVGKVAPLISGLIDKFGGLDTIIVKVGIGFASMKLVQVAGGIMSVVRSVNLLKAAMGGIVTGALFYILDDIVNHFKGGGSFFFDDLPGLMEDLKKELNIDFGIDTKQLKDLAESFGTLWKNTEGLRKSLSELGKVMLADSLNNMTAAINGLAAAVTFAMDLFNAFAEGGFSGGVQFIKDAIINSDGSGLKKASDGILGSSFLINPLSYIGNKGGEWVADKMGWSRKTEDGIIQPNGTLTRVAPDDWVFAVKNVADLAGALLPPGIYDNSTSSSSQSYVINQSLSVSGNASPQAVKQAAYRGTAEALKTNIRNASERMQMMPGTR